MSDSRFTTLVDDLDELVGLLGLDDVRDVETLLMCFLNRPVGVEEVHGEGVEPMLEVSLFGHGLDIGANFDFPLDFLEVARSCAEGASGLEPYQENEAPPNPPLDKLDDDQLVTVLRECLAKAIFFKLLDDD